MNENGAPLQISILLYPGVTALDAVGPWEVLSRIPNAEIRFVGKEEGPVVTECGALLLGIPADQRRLIPKIAWKRFIGLIRTGK